ncbi:MAG: signal peptide peptidase SppA [Candidatus Woesearchaeota archaeon]
MKNDPNKEPKKKIWTMIWILAILFLFSIIIAAIIGGNNRVTNYNTAIIGVKGEIVTEGSDSFFGSGVASSTEIISQLEEARHDPQINAIILEIDSPGGSPVATDEIAQEIKSIRNDNITVIAWIRETGASGAYWIASGAEHITANRMSIVGSIGVYGSYLEWYGLMNKYNVTYKRLVSGEYKDSGTPLRPMSSAEEAMMQEKLDKLHTIFIKEVATNRNMSESTLRKLATGEIYLGIEAKENGLIDELGGLEESKAYLTRKLNTTIETKEFARDQTFIESLMSAMQKNSFFVGQGIASAFMTKNEFKIKT